MTFHSGQITFHNYLALKLFRLELTSRSLHVYSITSGEQFYAVEHRILFLTGSTVGQLHFVWFAIW